jgi:hypothetical protein
MDLGMTIVAVVFIALLMWLYGEIRYSEGHDYGKVKGILSGASIIVSLFESRKVLHIDAIGNIYRITDAGGRGETIVSREEIDFIKTIDT